MPSALRAKNQKPSIRKSEKLGQQNFSTEKFKKEIVLLPNNSAGI